MAGMCEIWGPRESPFLKIISEYLNESRQKNKQSFGE